MMLGASWISGGLNFVGGGLVGIYRQGYIPSTLCVLYPAVKLSVFQYCVMEYIALRFTFWRRDMNGVVIMQWKWGCDVYLLFKIQEMLISPYITHFADEWGIDTAGVKCIIALSRLMHIMEVTGMCVYYPLLLVISCLMAYICRHLRYLDGVYRGS